MGFLGEEEQNCDPILYKQLTVTSASINMYYCELEQQEILLGISVYNQVLYELSKIKIIKKNKNGSAKRERKKSRMKFYTSNESYNSFYTRKSHI